jgi:hypothetical protein
VVKRFLYGEPTDYRSEEKPADVSIAANQIFPVPAPFVEISFTVGLDTDSFSALDDCKNFIADISEGKGFIVDSFSFDDLAQVTIQIHKDLLPVVQERYPNARLVD